MRRREWLVVGLLLVTGACGKEKKQKPPPPPLPDAGAPCTPAVKATPTSVALEGNFGGPPATATITVDPRNCPLEFDVTYDTVAGSWLKVAPRQGKITKPAPIELVATCPFILDKEPKQPPLVSLEIKGKNANPVVAVIPVSLACKRIPGPDIDVRQAGRFQVCVGESSSDGSLEVTNYGDSMLEVYDVKGAGVMVLEPNSFGVKPFREGDPVKVSLEATCKSRGTFNAKVYITSNDPDEMGKNANGDWIPLEVPISYECGCYAVKMCECAEGSSNTDPHLITMDGLKYDLQAAGEFVLAADGAFVVQVRQQPFRGQPVSVNTAVAARVAGHRVGYYMGQQPPLRVDGAPVEVAVGASHQLPGGAEVRRSDRSHTIVWPEGDELRLSAQGDYLNVALSATRGRSGKLRGLLGNRDGDPTNDLATQDGTPIALPPAFAKIHDDFADSWRIKQADSLFDYAAGESTATFTDLDFPKEPTTTSTLAPADHERGAAACRKAGITDPALLDSCILDVAVTGDDAMALGFIGIQAPVASVGDTYFADFEPAAGPEWSPARVEATPGSTARPSTRFIGKLGNEQATLTLSRLGPHDQLRVSFDLYIIQSWDGTSGAHGPDVWDLSADGASILRTTFANWPDPPTRQAYPDTHPGGDHPLGTGAAARDVLGYTWQDGRPMDAVYHLSFDIPHTASDARLVFSANGLQELADESWGLDNVAVTVYSSPVPNLPDFDSCTQGMGTACSTWVWQPDGRSFDVTGRGGDKSVVKVLKYDGTAIELASVSKPGRETRYKGTKTDTGFSGTVYWPPGTYGPREGKWTAKKRGR